MKSNKLVSLIKEVVKQEVKKQITDILINETNIPKVKPVVKKKKVEKRNYTDNPTLNKILNETASQQDDYPTLGGDTFETNWAIDFRSKVTVLAAQNTPAAHGVIWGIHQG